MIRLDTAPDTVEHFNGVRLEYRPGSTRLVNKWRGQLNTYTLVYALSVPKYASRTPGFAMAFPYLYEN
jgi:hypothetical protein